MRRFLCLLLSVLLSLSLVGAIAEEAAQVNITLDYNYEGGGVTTLTQAAPVTAVSTTPKHYGADFTGWYFDEACTEAFSAETPIDADVTLYAGWEAWTDEVKAKYDAYIAEMTLANDLAIRPQAYTKESFFPYDLLFTTIMLEISFNAARFSVTDDLVQEQIVELGKLREQLVKIGDEEEGVLYIWGDDMPQEPNVDDYDYYMTYTNKGFKPFLATYYAEDPMNAKGNIIVIAGGGYISRCNLYEGNNVAEFFQANGYNAYVLQRRIAPFAAIDSQIDLQRSVRYLRYNAEKLGIGATDKIGAVGFSGGGSTIMGCVNSYYGDIIPNVTYTDYVPDEIDQVNSDMQVMILVYGARDLVTENPNIPAAFIICGQNDGAANRSANLFLQLNERGVSADLHLFADCEHGFGMGDGFSDPVKDYSGSINGVKEWPSLALTFTDIKLGHLPRYE